jgi:hypothetical protein
VLRIDTLPDFVDGARARRKSTVDLHPLAL